MAAKNNEAATERSRFMITTRSGESVFLDKSTVVKYLTNNQQISDSEFTMFFQLCKANKVNPFLKEAYIIKYGTAPATIVLDYKVLQQIAEENKAYRGMKHGVIVQTKNGESVERLGEYVLPGETLIAGWCEVLRSDRDQPTKVVAMLNEFKAVKKDGSTNSNWLTKPCFMITKVAKAQALREAFPNMVGSNIYTKEETDSMAVPPMDAKKGGVVNDIVPEDTTPDEPAQKLDEDASEGDSGAGDSEDKDAKAKPESADASDPE